MQKRHGLAAALFGGALVATLAGCSANSTTPSPTPSATSTHEAAVTQKCVDGFMLIDADALEAKKPLTVKDDCATVSIVGSNATISLAAVDTIVFEGDHNKVEVASVKTVRLAGNENSLTHSSPEAPTVDDKGEGNKVAAG
jgi:hypothetical protein